MSDKIRGQIGELAVVEYLVSNGYTLLERNYNCRYGEIDIIVCNNEYIVFVEVKARGPRTIASPCEFVTKSKQRKIVTTSCFYLSNKKNNLQPRYDVFEVTLNDELPPKVLNIRHIENAFLTRGR